MSEEYPCIYFEKDGKCRKISDDTYISYCVMGPCPEQKLSNADRIRAMSDEELAIWLAEWSFCADACPASTNEVEEAIGYHCPSNCKEQALTWLQQPAEEET